MSRALQWATQSGDAWAVRWRDTDRALAALSPVLQSELLRAAPAGPFAALDVGCGPGSTSLDLALARPDSTIVACDLSPSLVEVARERVSALGSVEVVLGDVQQVAADRGPFDLIYSRHGVMFFADPASAFKRLRAAAVDGASLVFSCFQEWQANPWASELASAAAGRKLPPPGREPSAFAFAETAYVRQILDSAGWTQAEEDAFIFPYVAGAGDGAVEQALDFLCRIGPASRVVQSLAEPDREGAIQRMRRVIEDRFDGSTVIFTAAAWIWCAKAGG